MEEESHQPFQEVPDECNARVEAFWRDVDREAADQERLIASAAPGTSRGAR